jgi:ubiquinol-cytochrome c reductase iron-sulfur subunit
VTGDPSSPRPAARGPHPIGAARASGDLPGPGPGSGRAPAQGDREGHERRAERVVLLSFLVTLLSGVALMVVYAFGGQTQVEGLLLLLCLGGIGVGIVVWGQELMSSEVREEPRHPVGGGPEAQAELAQALLDEEGFTRRRALQLGMLGAFGGLGAALAIPVLSLGPAPGRSLFETPWRAGTRLVGFDGEPVTVDDLPLDGVLTVFPEGLPGDAKSQTVLINAGTRLQLEGQAAADAPNGFVAYSKICTHAGCPVGLYRAAQGELICPCHQSTFDVMRGAVPTFGPAARALPQLPIRIEADGTFTARSDYPEPVGPSFWNMELGPIVFGEDES